ncbi:MAG: hypothetical protein CW341_09535 [Bacteroidetes bacterium]|nr:hypothetical protein [Bacteroidota bacterium]
MTAIDLRTNINNELNSMSLNMLEKVADFVKSLKSENAPNHSISPLVASILTGHSVSITDAELLDLRTEYLKEKYL